MLSTRHQRKARWFAAIAVSPRRLCEAPTAAGAPASSTPCCAATSTCWEPKVDSRLTRAPPICVRGKGEPRVRSPAVPQLESVLITTVYVNTNGGYGLVACDSGFVAFDHGPRRADAARHDPCQFLAGDRVEFHLGGLHLLDEGRVLHRSVEGAAQRLDDRRRDAGRRRIGLPHLRARRHE